MLEKSINKKYNFKHHTNAFEIFLQCLFRGLTGFAVLFTLIIIVKAIGSAFGTLKYFDMTLYDVNIALLGFVIMFFFSFF